MQEVSKCHSQMDTQLAGQNDQLLAQAKTRVEQLIEEAVRS